jgi:hypothetical protein
MQYFSCTDRPGVDLRKSTIGHVTPNLCFLASGAICGSLSVFCCIRGVKYRRNIFDAQVGPVCIP